MAVRGVRAAERMDPRLTGGGAFFWEYIRRPTAFSRRWPQIDDCPLKSGASANNL